MGLVYIRRLQHKVAQPFKWIVHHIMTARKPTVMKGIVVLLCLSVISLLCLSYYVSNIYYNGISRTPPEPTIKCRTGEHGDSDREGPRDHTSSASLRIDNKVLVMVETQYSRQGQEILALLEANRIKFKIELAHKGLPYLTRKDKGKYGVIIFENLESYVNMDKWNRQLLDKYCLEYNVGIISFTYMTENALIKSQVKGFPLFVHTNLAMKDYELNPNSEILRITRPGEMYHSFLPGDDWTVFLPNHTTYEPLSYAKTQTADIVSQSNSIEEATYITAVQDLGLYDGIQRIFFGNGFKFWLHRVLFLDALSYLSHGKFSIPLERYILIDIDDIFVGKTGIRLKQDDVRALVSAQTRLQENIDGFRFNLGYSGKYFHSGSREENQGDDLLLDFADMFWWFPHMWRHTQPHKYTNISYLLSEMLHNKRFAKEHGIPVDSEYAVAPHHSGVFPIHEELYESWKRVWNIKVTSTEEYPHLRPARRRRGFIHRGIMVLPRQTCGLFTHTILIDKYPGGRGKLEEMIRGGELFQTFLYNPINVFMTHMSNYGNDRLALYTFESVVKFVRCWTNLKLVTIPPVELGKLYFDLYPDEEDPIWRNPCDDKRHLQVWAETKTCDRLPNFLVVGPQKTGTTALYTFLSMHPHIVSNYPSSSTFEEVQFFHGKNYYNGLDWYMEFFPHHNKSQWYLFEKSATYFDSDDAPRRAHALLPRAKLITILVNPIKRAYSWYQHIRAHQDRTALTYTFYDIVSADSDAPRAVRELRNRCLDPGTYAIHLERWLTYFPPSQLLILDGDELKTDPVSIMDKVQLFLGVEPYLDYSNRLKYNAKKGFYCQVVKGDHTQCLGRSKGRIYPPMELKAQHFLRNYYKKYNVALSKMLSSLGQPVPEWLEEELREE